MALSLPDQVERLLSFAEPVTAAVLIVRLVQAGLIKRYRAFALYLVCIVAEIVVLMSVPRDTIHYFYVYVAVESVLSFTQILVITELFSLVTEAYPGIARSGRRFLWAALAIAVFVSVGVLFFGHTPQPTGAYFRLLAPYLVIARSVSLTLALFLLLTLTFLFWFPIALSRNVVVYVIGYSVYFGCRALTRMVSTLTGDQIIATLSTISLAITLGCLFLWIVLLSKKGDYVSVTVGHRWQPGEGEALVRQLESINRALLRTSGK